MEGGFGVDGKLVGDAKGLGLGPTPNHRFKSTSARKYGLSNFSGHYRTKGR
jgi:hypothetical protein